MENEDRLEPLIREILEDSDFLEAMLNILKKMKEAGIVNLANNIANDYLPTDIEFLGKFFASKELVYGALKSANTAVSVIHALSDERTSDLVKAVMFNMPDAADGMITAAKTQDKISMMKIYSMMKDPEIAAGISVMFSFLKFLGAVMKKVD
ncbi:MAG: DUF1641 domain-containing protein [Candidatus Thermoplasmatota archaeon]|jgi:uncharacterized protein YjgD (DUF1641 family)|nr:DUF1641 domain-containing protein [Candidatus Thermoplasmatota archaeon]MCL5441840.1 DUF1641 domain-containing protein [Candidatus Thermoplasmatota archaeon]